MRHVPTCLIIANDDAISKFLFSSLKSYLNAMRTFNLKDGGIPFETCSNLLNYCKWWCNFEISICFYWVSWKTCEFLKDDAMTFEFFSDLLSYCKWWCSFKIVRPKIYQHLSTSILILNLYLVKIITVHYMFHSENYI